MQDEKKTFYLTAVFSEHHIKRQIEVTTINPIENIN
jgi:hypothetical protein